MELRRTTSDDLVFRNLTAQLDAELRARYGDVQSQYAAFNAFECDTVIVAGDAGCGCFKRYDARAAELKRVYVRPDARGRGIAAAIVHGLEAWARELGYTAMQLETGNLQAEAIALYARLGYARIPPYGPYADLPASVCFARPL